MSKTRSRIRNLAQADVEPDVEIRFYIVSMMDVGEHRAMIKASASFRTARR